MFCYGTSPSTCMLKLVIHVMGNLFRHDYNVQLLFIVNTMSVIATSRILKNVTQTCRP